MNKDKDKKVVGKTSVKVDTTIYDDGTSDVLITPMGGTGGPPCDPKINPLCG